MYPPIVLLLIKPSAHKTNRITEIVHNIGGSFRRPFPQFAGGVSDVYVSLPLP